MRVYFVVAHKLKIAIFPFFFSHLFQNYPTELTLCKEGLLILFLSENNSLNTLGLEYQV